MGASGAKEGDDRLDRAERGRLERGGGAVGPGEPWVGGMDQRGDRMGAWQGRRVPDSGGEGRGRLWREIGFGGGTKGGGGGHRLGARFEGSDVSQGAEKFGQRRHGRLASVRCETAGCNVASPHSPPAWGYLPCVICILNSVSFCRSA